MLSSNRFIMFTCLLLVVTGAIWGTTYMGELVQGLGCAINLHDMALDVSLRNFLSLPYKFIEKG